jgi:Domain of unknown function (DUF4404)
MPSDREQLLATLEQLRRQLDDTPSLQPAMTARLRATLADLEGALAGKNPAGEQRLRERLGQAALDFEASHPMLSGNVGSIIVALGRMGI